MIANSSNWVSIRCGRMEPSLVKASSRDRRPVHVSGCAIPPYQQTRRSGLKDATRPYRSLIEQVKEGGTT